ncbi:hypothetical protein FE257_007182, partial [Aspergillus nanangensis]
MKQHLQTHQPIKKGRGRPKKTSTILLGDYPIQPWWDEIACQRFFVSGPQSHFFPVTPSYRTSATSETDYIREQVYKQLWQLEQDQEQQSQIITADCPYHAVDPWLEKTRWQDYTQGYTLSELACLAYMPDIDREPLLQLWTQSLDTILDQAIQSLLTHRVNAFDQARINSFIEDAYRRPSHRPVFYHLQPATEKRYRRIWKRLFCFIYRISQPTQSIQLRHRFTAVQAHLLSEMMQCSQQLHEQTSAISNPLDRPEQHMNTRSQDLSEQLNRICLLFCIALLDHVLHGDIFESVVVGFFAILGIDEQKQTFRSAYLYTPVLSG